MAFESGLTKLNVYRAGLRQEVGLKAPVSLTGRGHVSQRQPDAKLTVALLLANRQETKMIRVEAPRPSEQPIRFSLRPDQPTNDAASKDDVSPQTGGWKHAAS